MPVGTLLSLAQAGSPDFNNESVGIGWWVAGGSENLRVMQNTSPRASKNHLYIYEVAYFAYG